MQCAIYKGRRKAETYIYIECADDFSRVPQALLDMLGQLELIMELDLVSREQLAYADINEVRHLLKEQGYYLQMPPDENAPRI